MGEESFSYRSLLIFGEISALLAIFAGTTYALGLMAIWVPTVVITNDIDTAWLAVSMMRRTVVAGVSIRYLFGIPLLVLGAPLTFIALQNFLYWVLNPKSLKARVLVMTLAFFVGSTIWVLFMALYAVIYNAFEPGTCV